MSAVGTNMDIIDAFHIGDKSRVDSLIKAGASVDLQDRYGNTAMFCFVVLGNTHIINWIII